MKNIIINHPVNLKNQISYTALANLTYLIFYCPQVFFKFLFPDEIFFFIKTLAIEKQAESNLVFQNFLLQENLKHFPHSPQKNFFENYWHDYKYLNAKQRRLLSAIKNGQINDIKEILSENSEPDHQIAHHDKKLKKSKGVLINFCDRHGFSPLWWAMKSNKQEIIKILEKYALFLPALESKIYPFNTNLFSPTNNLVNTEVFYYAAVAGNAMFFKRIIRDSASLFYYNKLINNIIKKIIIFGNYINLEIILKKLGKKELKKLLKSEENTSNNLLNLLVINFDKKLKNENKQAYLNALRLALIHSDYRIKKNQQIIEKILTRSHLKKIKILMLETRKEHPTLFSHIPYYKFLKKPQRIFLLISPVILAILAVATFSVSTLLFYPLLAVAISSLLFTSFCFLIHDATQGLLASKIKQMTLAIKNFVISGMEKTITANTVGQTIIDEANAPLIENTSSSFIFSTYRKKNTFMFTINKQYQELDETNFDKTHSLKSFS